MVSNLGEPVKMRPGSVCWNAANRNAQPFADGIGDIAHPYAFFGGAMQAQVALCSNASRKRRAASSRCTAGQRFLPLPTYAETPVLRAISISAGTNPWWPARWTDGGKRNVIPRTPRAEAAASVCSEGVRTPGKLSNCAGWSSVVNWPGVTIVVPAVLTIKGRATATGFACRVCWTRCQPSHREDAGVGYRGLERCSGSGADRQCRHRDRRTQPPQVAVLHACCAPRCPMGRRTRVLPWLPSA
jgi:hypothetical protein